MFVTDGLLHFVWSYGLCISLGCQYFKKCQYMTYELGFFWKVYVIIHVIKTLQNHSFFASIMRISFRQKYDLVFEILNYLLNLFEILIFNKIWI